MDHPVNLFTADALIGNNQNAFSTEAKNVLFLFSVN